MKVTPARLRKHLDRWEVPYTLVKGWDSPNIDPYHGRSDFVGVVLHHTAGMNSLNYIVSGNPYAPVRAAHFYVSRSGHVSVCSGVGAYHAGAGGPYRFTRTVVVPKDSGNSRLYGIEIESLGTSAKIDGSAKGMTTDQVVSTALLCAALLDAMRTGPLSYRVGRIIRHRDWTPRKIDTQQDLQWWRNVVGLARRNKGNRAKAVRLIRDYVAAHPDGRA
jgi:N-acetyl-anhydromuramyl-L-alanine amidase AmpD